ncbi:diguanylate cyclase [Achromobacter sp. NPDC058515]|uniref:diguanylate cyclase n=1 Tax=Achromobacter sp. NPDC058515 TaxID=3346533 RepID=UPI00364B4DC4
MNIADQSGLIVLSPAERAQAAQQVACLARARCLLRGRWRLRDIDFAMPDDPALLILLYFIPPLWMVAGIADWFCHRRSDIARTSGAKESWLHMLMFAQMGSALLACLFLEINALIFAFVIAMFFAHEATALWDVSYAHSRRRISPVEQHIHSFLELLPLLAIVLLAVRHWDAFLSLFGQGQTAASWTPQWKTQPLPAAYIYTLLAAGLFLEILPYLEELLRGMRKRR